MLFSREEGYGFFSAISRSNNTGFHMFPCVTNQKHLRVFHFLNFKYDPKALLLLVLDLIIYVGSSTCVLMNLCVYCSSLG